MNQDNVEVWAQGGGLRFPGGEQVDAEVLRERKSWIGTQKYGLRVVLYRTCLRPQPGRRGVRRMPDKSPGARVSHSSLLPKCDAMMRSLIAGVY